MRLAILIVAPALALAGPCCAGTTLFTDFDAWSDAIGHDFTTITFTEPGEIVVLDDQYSHLGILFPESNDFVSLQGGFLNDQWGALSTLDASITVDFSQEVHWIGVHYPGVANFFLYDDDVLIYESIAEFPGGHGFAGLITTEPFDRAVLWGAFGDHAIDDLHIANIPAPGTLVVLLSAALVGPGRRRRGRT